MSLKKMVGDARGQYYLNLAREDYYFTGQSPLRWAGSLAEQLGFRGEVDKETFEQALRGRTNDGKGVRNAGDPRRVSGWDGTFSVDKTVSAYWSQADELTRAAIEEEVHAAVVEDVLPYAEEVVGWTRRGAGGKVAEKARLLAATTMHYTARRSEAADPDPQLHVHCIFFNLTKRDEKTLTIDGERLYDEQMTLGALFRAAVAQRLQRRLGLAFERDGWRTRLQGPASLHALAERMSHRRDEVEEVLQRTGADSARAAEMAALATRRPKDEQTLGPASLFPAWHALGREVGFTRAQTRALLGKATAPDLERCLDTALRAATEAIGRERATFTAGEFLRAVADRSLGVGTRDLREAAKKHLQGKEIVCLGASNSGQQYYTTEENWRLEAELLRVAQRLHDDKSHAVSGDAVQGAIAANPLLSAEQQGGTHRLCGASGLGLLVGNPGTGKTSLLAAVRQAHEEHGYRVLGACISAKAAKELSSAGIESVTVTRLIGSKELGVKGDLDPQTPADRARAALRRGSRSRERLTLDGPSRTLLVIDEAGQCGVRTLRRLLHEAERTGGRVKVILAGDPKQLQPIKDGGSALKHLTERFGAARLTTIRRQSEKDDRAAIEAYARGDVAGSLASFARRGKVVVAEDKKEAVGKLVEEWAKAPEGAFVLTRTRREAAIVNALCKERCQQGKPETPGLEIGEATFHRGDRAMFTRNSRYFGVRNGELGTVTAVNPHAGTVTVQVDGSRARVTLPVAEYDHLTHGWAMTVYKSQGSTAARALVLGHAAMSREAGFVALSRHRLDVRCFVTREEAGEDLTRLVRTLGRSEAQPLAHERTKELDGGREA